jgi:hypothetical protein
VNESCIALTAPQDAAVVIGRKKGRIGDTEAHFLAFHVAVGQGGGGHARRIAVADLRQQGIALLLEGDGGDGKGDEEQGHRGKHRPALAFVADDAAEGNAQRAGNQEDRQHLQEVHQRRRVLEGVCRVGVEEAAAVGAKHLDRLLRSNRTHRQGLRRVEAGSVTGVALLVLQRLAVGVELGIVVCRDLQRRHFLVGSEVLDHALTGQEQREKQRQRQQNPDGGAEQVCPRIADASSLNAVQSRG